MPIVHRFPAFALLGSALGTLRSFSLMGSKLKASVVLSFAEDTRSVLDIPRSHMTPMALLGGQEELKALCLGVRAANGFNEEERVFREPQRIVSVVVHRCAFIMRSGQCLGLKHTGQE